MKKLLLITIFAFCSIPQTKANWAMKACQILRANKMNAFVIATSCLFPMFIENSNSKAIDLLQQENNQIQQKFDQAQQNASLKDMITSGVIIGIALLPSTYLYINYKYNQFLKQRPSITTILKTAKTPQEIVAELNKYEYNQQDFKKIVKPSPTLTQSQIDNILAQLA